MQGESRIRKRTWAAGILLAVGIPLLLAVSFWAFQDRNYYFISVCMILLAMLPFFFVFEGRKPQAREILVIAVLTALAVIGRSVFFMIPQVKPMAAIVIIAGIMLGAEAGFLTGALAAFVSNFIFGQGPWTPWQMFAFGVLGFLAGILFYRKHGEELESRFAVCLYGGLSTLLLYGIIMDTSTFLMYSSELTVGGLIATCVSGFPYNLVHAASTVVFLWVLYRPMAEKLQRVRLKYGMS